MYEIKGNWFVRQSSGCLIYIIYIVGYAIVFGFVGAILNTIFPGVFTPAFFNSWWVVLVAIGACALLVVYSKIFKSLFYRFIRCAEKQLNRKIKVGESDFNRWA